MPTVPASSYTRAQISYLNHRGRVVNVAEPGGHISTTEHDQHGNVVRQLTAANRARALAAGSDSVARSRELDTQNTYSTDGLELLQTLGPRHEVRLKSGETVQARQKTITIYDEGNPYPDPVHLPTTVRTGAQVDGEAGLLDERVTKYRYTENGTNRGWELREPSATVVDAAPGGLQLTSSVRHHPTEPLVIETRSPAGNAGGGDANATKIIHYTTGTNTADAECGNRPEWYGQICKRVPVAQPGGTLPAIPTVGFSGYNELLQPQLKTTTNGSNERFQYTHFDAAGRQTGESTSFRAWDGTRRTANGVDIKYDASSGRMSTVSSWVCAPEGGGTARTAGTTAQTSSDIPPPPQCNRTTQHVTTRAHDQLGRLTSYTDADGNVSTTTYDALDRPITTDDGKGSQTRTYDPTRGLLTALEDSAAGSFTATYDPDGQLLTQTLPNGLTARYTSDETGARTALAYQKTSHCTQECTWLAFDATENIHGQQTSQDGTLSSQRYDYDNAGRLIGVEDRPGGQGCQTRRYGYDADSNRTSLTTRASEPDGSCARSGGATRTFTYDQADRITGPGYEYDAYGRIETVPASDAGGHALYSGYYLNDRAQRHAQNGTSQQYELDPVDRVRARRTTRQGSVTDSVYHYSGDNDQPSWITENSSWTRNISGIDGDLLATQVSDAATALQLANLHGDIVAEAFLDPAATGPVAAFESTEFGEPREPQSRRYAWLGGKQRSTELPSGLIQMGDRTYLPTIGRFLQTDPVAGGSANAYDYGNQDPINQWDLDGNAPGPCSSYRGKWHPNSTPASRRRAGCPAIPPPLKGQSVTWAFKLVATVGCAGFVKLPVAAQAVCTYLAGQEAAGHIPRSRSKNPFCGRGGRWRNARVCR